MSRYILGISAFYHDSAAALLKDGKVVFAAQEERFNRVKNFPGFPARAVRAALDWAEKREGKGPGLAGVEAVAFYDKPLLKFERLIETYYAYAPRGFAQFLSAAPVWVGEKMLLKRTLRKELAKIDPSAAGIKLLFPEHHLSHAASAFYPSPFGEAAVLTVDGVGEWATASICAGRGKDLTILKELRFPHSLGLLYSAFTAYTGFKVNSGEYKLMGLAPYGDPASSRTAAFIRKIKDVLADLKDDGSVRLDQDYFDYTTGLKMTKDDRWEALFGLPPRRPGSALKQEYCDMALAAQEFTGEALCRIAAHAVALTGSRDLCLAGGVALNCVANGRILKAGICDRIWIQPAAGDAGGALGAALAAWHIYSGEPRVPEVPDGMGGALLGPDYTGEEAETFARSAGAVYEKLGYGELCARTAKLLASGAVVGWFQGRMEWGPRALGNRSILADARDPEMRKKLNLKIKHREGFRPFAPSVREEDAGEFFEDGFASPYMLLIDHVSRPRRIPGPAHGAAPDLEEKLSRPNSDIPAVTHLDHSSRVQTVSGRTNPRYHALLTAFKELTGCGLLVNTSFNVREEPIVCSPADAYACFMRTDLDHLVMGDLLFDKARQPRRTAAEDGGGDYADD